MNRKRKNEIKDTASRKKAKLDVCSICLGQLENSQFKYKLPCGHTFHRDCIDRWLKIKPNCPYCRKYAIYDDDTMFEQLIEEVTNNFDFNFSIEESIVNMELSDSSDDYAMLSPTDFLFLEEINMYLENDI